MKLPDPGQLIGVFVLRDRRLLQSRVEDVQDDGTVMIAMPTENGLPFALSIGEEISIEWPTRRGLLEGRGTVRGKRDYGLLPLLEVGLSGTAVRQRREYVRAEVVLDVELTRADGGEIRCATLDVSGSGVRLVLECDLEENEVVDLVLHVPDMPPVFARAVLVRFTAENECAMRFVEMDPNVRERLIQFAFSADAREAATVRRN